MQEEYGANYIRGRVSMIYPDGDKLIVKQRFIKTGATQGDLIVVTDGLNAGEQIVTSGLLKLRNDAEVTINDAIQPSADASPTPENR